MSDTLLRFKTRVPQRPNFALVDTHVKIMGPVGKILGVNIRTITYAPAAFFRLPICCSVSKPEHLEGDWYQEVKFFTF